MCSLKKRAGYSQSKQPFRLSPRKLPLARTCFSYDKTLNRSIGWPVSASVTFPTRRIVSIGPGESEAFSSGDASSRTRLTASSFVEDRSEEHTSELQSRFDLVCRLLLEKK